MNNLCCANNTIDIQCIGEDAIVAIEKVIGRDLSSIEAEKLKAFCLREFIKEIVEDILNDIDDPQ